MSAVTAFPLTQIVVNIIQTHTGREPSLIGWTLRGFPTSAGFRFDSKASGGPSGSNVRGPVSFHVWAGGNCYEASHVQKTV